MKRFWFAITIALPMFFTGCSKEGDEVVTQQSDFSAIIDGSAWKASNYAASIYQGSITIEGESADGRTITINLSGDSLGTYTLGQSSTSTATYAPDGTPGNVFATGGSITSGGTVNVSSTSSNLISGSFSFTASRVSDGASATITAGVFSMIPYGSKPIGTAGNSMSMKLDGGNWSPSTVDGFVAFERLYINASDGGGSRVFNFEFPEDIGPGTYELNYFTNYKAEYINTSGNTYYAINGTLEIESHNIVNRQIKGTFETKLEAHETSGITTVTEGQFEIIYE